MERSAPKKQIPAPAIAGIIVAAVLVALVAAYCALCAWVQGNGKLLPGTVAADEGMGVSVDLGKLTLEDAVAQMEQHVDDRLGERTLTISYGDGQTAVLSGSLLDSDPASAVAYGMTVKEAQPFLKLGALWLGIVKEPVQLSLASAAFTPAGEREARDIILSIADELFVAPVDFTYEIGEETVEVTPGVDGQSVDPNQLFELVQHALTTGQATLRVETTADPSAELTGQILSQLVYTEPQPPALDADGNLIPTVMGRSIDPAEAQAILDAAEPGQVCSIPLILTAPDFTGVEGLLFQDLLSSVTTTLDGVATRSFNVGLAASTCNDTILLPGETFSYLGTIGDPSAANGYQPSTGYQNGLTVPMDGGGVCQVSSSLYYCAVYANLEIVRRAAHAFSTGYIPNGLDATVYYPSLDFLFRNNTDYPIKIVAYTEGGASGRLTVQFYGTNPDGHYVQTERHTLSSTPWETRYQPDETVPVGTTKVEITPYTGYEVEVYRLVYSADGTLISRTYENYSKYAKRDKVILFNPADAANLGLDPSGNPLDPSVAPPVTPSPEPSPDVSPEPSPDVTPEPTPDVTPEPSPDVTPEPSPEPSPEVSPDLPPLVTQDPMPIVSDPIPDGTRPPDAELPVQPTPVPTGA